MRAGFLLIELLIALVIAAIVAAIALPRLAAIADTAAVRAETMRLVAAVDRARGAAERLGTVATLTIADTSYRIVAIVDGDTILPFEQRGAANNGVTITGAGQPIDFGPAGLAMGVANRTITLSRGMVARKVVLSKFGRLTY